MLFATAPQTTADMEPSALEKPTPDARQLMIDMRVLLYQTNDCDSEM